MRFLEFDERRVGVQAKGIGFVCRGTPPGGDQRDAMGVEELLKEKDVRAYVPQLAIERELVGSRGDGRWRDW